MSFGQQYTTITCQMLYFVLMGKAQQIAVSLKDNPLSFWFKNKGVDQNRMEGL